jgi:hypothetical protein
MKKRDLKARIAALEAEIEDLKRQLEIANQYAEIMRGYQPPYVVDTQIPCPFIAPGDPGYMPAFPDHNWPDYDRYSTAGPSPFVQRESTTAGD